MTERTTRSARPTGGVLIGLSLAGLALAGLVLAGCGGDDGEATSVPSSTQTSFPTDDPSATGTVREVGDPCEAVTGAEMATLLGLDGALSGESAGEGNYRGCSFTDADGVVVINLTRYASAAPFDEVWASLGDLGDAEVRELAVDGADGGGLIVAAEEGSLAMTAAVAHDGLVDLANFYVLAPYDEAATTAGITTVLERLVAQPAP
ncbi:MAG TPA: DUF3558 family protein [Nocardioides sp.]